MKTKTTYRPEWKLIRKWFLVMSCGLSIVGCFTACSDEQLEPAAIPADSIEATISLDLPGDMYSQSTKAMSDDDEKKIEDMRILAFRWDGTVYGYSYTAFSKAAPIITGNTATFKVDLWPYDENQVFVFLANAGGEAEAAGINYGEDIETVLPKLTVTQATEWPAKNNGAAAIKYIPMYARTSTGVKVTSGLTLNCTLIRMLARIDIVNNAASAFQLTGAYLYHRLHSGYISHREDAGWWDNGLEKVLQAYTPVTPGTTKNGTTFFNTTAANRITNSIYTFETAGVTDRAKATALVVGGRYNGSVNTTYYRVDIPEFDTAGNPVADTMGDILRNHLYTITINSVTVSGADSPEDAYDGGVTLDATITPWNLAKNAVVFDGQYTFNISRNRLVYDKDAATYPVEVSTDHPDGITVGSPVYVTGAGGWLTLSGHTPGTKTGTLSAAATANTTGAARSATVILTVGGTGTELEYILTATQSEAGWLEWTNHQIYYTNGKAYTTVNGNAAKITSVANWSATVTNAGTLFASQTFTNGGTGIGTPVDYPFTLKDNGDSDLYHIAEITFKDLSGTFPDKTYPVVNMEGSTNNVANSIIVTGTGAVTIPSAYRKAYAIWRCGDGKSGALGDISTMGTLGAKVVWQDANGMISDANVSFNISTGAITIAATSSSVGNAVVALQAGGVNVWSWHIWKPSTAPTDLNGWMNMNLGAMNATPGNAGSMGLLYQWGRKDPFLTSNAFANGGATKPSFDGAGGRVHAADNYGSPSEPVSVLNNLENSIRTPFTFYLGTSNTGYDWYTNTLGTASPNNELNMTEYANQNSYLWNSRLGNKTPFDPCPAHYRVPARKYNNTTSPWNGLNSNNFGWAYNSRYSNGHGGYYPAAGGRHQTNGTLSNASDYGYYWGSSPTSSNSLTLIFNFADYVQNDGNTNRASGFSVRCMQGD